MLGWAVRPGLKQPSTCPWPKSPNPPRSRCLVSAHLGWHSDAGGGTGRYEQEQPSGYGVYDEAIDLAALGQLNIRRGGHVEPRQTGGWSADLAPVNGPVLGPFATRSAALAAE